MEIHYINVEPDFELTLDKYSDEMNRFSESQEFQRWAMIVANLPFEGESSKAHLEFFLESIRKRIRGFGMNIKLARLEFALIEHKNKRLSLERVKDTITDEQGQIIQDDLVDEFNALRAILIDTLPDIFPSDF
jgi:hypothetical protein